MASIERFPTCGGRRRARQECGKAEQSQIAQTVVLRARLRQWLRCYFAVATAGLGWTAWDSSLAKAQTVRLASQPGLIETAPPNFSASNAPIRALPVRLQSDGESLLPTNQTPAIANDVSPSDQATAEATQANDQASADAGAQSADKQQLVDPESAERMAAEAVFGSEALTLADVIASVYRAYPMIVQARLQGGVARGELLESYGAFDTKLEGYTLEEPTGFYRNYRHGIGLARQTWWGGYVSAGYRIGRGDFQPWYKERETEKGGEFKVGLAWPLLQGRAIDANRVGVFQATLTNQAVVPQIQQTILEISREAALGYWDWVAAGTMLLAQEELLDLAIERGDQLEAGVEAELFPAIDQSLNRVLIADRRSKVLDSQRKFQSTAFKLSLYLRDENGQPLVPRADWLPQHFPIIEELPVSDFQQDLANALARRPEPRLLQLDLRALSLDRQLATNNLLPRVDVIAEASQDMGQPASSTDDKGEFQLLLGLQGEVPIQRRKARGKILSTSAKIAQVTEKLRLQQDKIGTELQIAYNALDLSAQIIEQSEEALLIAIDVASSYRRAFENNYYTLLDVNIIETKVTESELKLIDAQRAWFDALAEMQAALGLDPLDQAVSISALPASSRPGPGFLPDPKPLDVDQLRPPENAAP